MRKNYYPKVEHIELSDKNTKRRLIAAVVFGIIAVIAIVISVSRLMTTEPGWQNVTSQSKEPYASEFVFQYEFGKNATAENRQLTSYYTELTGTAYKLFSSDKSFENIANLRFLSLNPNKEIELDPALYSALKRMDDRRELFYAPIYSEYSSLYFSQTDSEAVAFDPEFDAEEKKFIDELLAFVNDPGMISLEFLGNNKVNLRISDEYLSFANENEIKEFISFGWMKNAFVIDYLADNLSARGFTKGILTSFEGFVRNLSDTTFVYPINDRVGNTVYNAANAEIPAKNSLVCFRDFMLNSQDTQNYYEYSDGTTRTPYIGADGRCHSSISSLILYSDSKSCSELLLEGLDIYVADEFNENLIKSDSIYCENFVIHASGDAEIGQIYSKDKVYTLRKN